MQRFLIAALGLSLCCAVASPQEVSSGHANNASTTVTAQTDNKQSTTDLALQDQFATKIKAEWEAVKNKDKKTYGELLADEYQGVEVDGAGERNKLQAVAELVNSNVFNYTLWGLKVTSLGPDATFIVYESTMQFPPGAQIRFSRVYIGELWVKRDSQWKLLHYQETRVK